MKSSNFSSPAAELDARTARFGLRIAAGLTERSAVLPRDVSERLRFAREQALTRAQAARLVHTATAASGGMVHAGASLAMRGGPGMPAGRGVWPKWVSALPLALLIAGLLLMQRGQFHEQIVATAEVDTALLSDTLPPDAYADPGFAEFLRDGQE